MIVRSKIVVLTIIPLMFLCCSQKKQGYSDPREEMQKREQTHLTEKFGSIHSSDALKLNIRMDHTEYVQGEPFKIVYSLKNTSTEVINVEENFEDASGVVGFTMQAESGKFISLHSCLLLNYRPSNDYWGLSLAPGDSIIDILYPIFSDDKYINYIPDADHLMIADPGDYVIRAVYQVADRMTNLWTGRLTSNDIHIHIYKTSDADFSAMSQFLSGSRSRWNKCMESLIPYRSYSKEAEYNKYFAIAKTYPNTVYGKYSNYYIGLYLIHRDPLRAVAIFKELISQYPEFRPEEIHYGLLECYDSLGMYKEYETIINNFKFDGALYNKGVFRHIRNSH